MPSAALSPPSGARAPASTGPHGPELARPGTRVRWARKPRGRWHSRRRYDACPCTPTGSRTPPGAARRSCSTCTRRSARSPMPSVSPSSPGARGRPEPAAGLHGRLSCWGMSQQDSVRIAETAAESLSHTNVWFRAARDPLAREIEWFTFLRACVGKAPLPEPPPRRAPVRLAAAGSRGPAHPRSGRDVLPGSLAGRAARRQHSGATPGRRSAHGRRRAGRDAQTAAMGGKPEDSGRTPRPGIPPQVRGISTSDSSVPPFRARRPCHHPPRGGAAHLSNSAKEHRRRTGERTDSASCRCISSTTSWIPASSAVYAATGEEQCRVRRGVTVFCLTGGDDGVTRGGWAPSGRA